MGFFVKNVFEIFLYTLTQVIHEYSIPNPTKQNITLTTNKAVTYIVVNTSGQSILRGELSSGKK